MFWRKLKECWPAGNLKKTAAPKLFYFIHNLAEWYCVNEIGKRRLKKPKREKLV